MKKKLSILILVVLFELFGFNYSTANEQIKFCLNEKLVEKFYKLAFRCISQEYPNKIGHVLNSNADIKGPRNLHPAFYGCFDWHSAVHGHWSLVKILKMFPKFPHAPEIREAIYKNLTPDNIKQECLYFQTKGRNSFERTYGWAWLLKLCEELHAWDDQDARVWKKSLEPLEKILVEKYLEFLPKQNYPIRTGVHPNTAFGLAFGLDYARVMRNSQLEDLIIKKANEYYLNDQNCPASWEPGGEDFFSPCLMEAYLMSKILLQDKFNEWFNNFLPGFKGGEIKSLLIPATVLDRSDGKLVHLDGLNLSRAWAMFGIAQAISESELKDILINTGIDHGKSALNNMKSDDYAGGHWLGSFAIYMFTSIQD